MKLNLARQVCWESPSGRVWKRRLYIRDYIPLEEDNLIRKREEPIKDKEKETLEEGYIDWKTYYDSNCVYDPKLKLEENIFKLLLDDLFDKNKGLFIQEINAKLMTHNRVKCLTRVLNNMIKKELIRHKMTRGGKSLFKLHSLKVDKIDAKYFKDSRKKKLINCNNELKRLLGDIFFWHTMENETALSNMLEQEIFVELINKLGEVKDKALRDTILENNKLLKIFTFLYKNRDENVINLINDFEYKFLSEKFMSFTLTNKEKLFPSKQRANKDKRSLILTDLRLSRIMRILNILHEKRCLPIREIINDIRDVLEQDKNYTVDKKTIIHICYDLEEIGLIKTKKFDVDYEEKNVEKLINSKDKLKQMKIFYIYFKYDVDNDDLFKSEYMQRPFYSTKKAQKKEDSDEGIFFEVNSEDESKFSKESINKLVRMFKLMIKLLSRRDIDIKKSITTRIINNAIHTNCKAQIDSSILKLKDSYFGIDLSEYLNVPDLTQKRKGSQHHHNVMLEGMNRCLVDQPKLCSLNRSLKDCQKMLYQLKHGIYVNFNELLLKATNPFVCYMVGNYLLEKEYIETMMIEDRMMIRLKLK